MLRKIHMQDQVRNRAAVIMEDGRSVCMTRFGHEGAGGFGVFFSDRTELLFQRVFIAKGLLFAMALHDITNNATDVLFRLRFELAKRHSLPHFLQDSFVNLIHGFIR